MKEGEHFRTAIFYCLVIFCCYFESCNAENAVSIGIDQFDESAILECRGSSSRNCSWRFPKSLDNKTSFIDDCKVFVENRDVGGGASCSVDNENFHSNVRFNDRSFRLPRHLQPISYNITIKVNAKPKQTFNGEVVIELIVLESSNNVTLHAHRTLDIRGDEIEVVKEGGEVSVIGISTDADKSLYVISTAKRLAKGDILSVKIPYTGRFNNDGKQGLYWKFDSKSGSYVFASQMQSIYARRVYPCLDEPDLKAAFRVNVVRPRDYISLSNAEKRSERVEVGSGSVLDEYEVTPVMSTYLVAIIVAKYEHLETRSQRYRKTFKTWSLPNDKEKAIFASKLAPIVYNELADDFQYYPSANLDPVETENLVSVPDMKHAAMENWGLMIFKYRYLLESSPNSTHEEALSNRALIAGLISHEFSHIYFGNLVTMKWWDDLWLNEGFANYFGYIFADKVSNALKSPRFETKKTRGEEDLESDIQSSFSADYFGQPRRALRHEINGQQQLRRMDLQIVYGKGAAMVKMLVAVMGRSTFNAAMRKYIEKFKFKNVDQYDLFDVLQTEYESGLNGVNLPLPDDVGLAEVMNAWTNQPGFPVVHVERDKSDPRLIRLWQNITFGPGTRLGHDKPDRGWWIPVSYSHLDSSDDELDSTPKLWLPPDFSAVTEIRLKRSVPIDAPLVFNAGGIGYFLVNYDAQNWLALNEAVKNRRLNKRDGNRLKLSVRYLWDGLPVKLGELIDIRTA